jgi:hypothetical protein
MVSHYSTGMKERLPQGILQGHEFQAFREHHEEHPLMAALTRRSLRRKIFSGRSVLETPR